MPSERQTLMPSDEPSARPSASPSDALMYIPGIQPSPHRSASPSDVPTPEPMPVPTLKPTPEPLQKFRSPGPESNLSQLRSRRPRLRRSRLTPEPTLEPSPEPTRPSQLRIPGPTSEPMSEPTQTVDKASAQADTGANTRTDSRAYAKSNAPAHQGKPAVQVLR